MGRISISVGPVQGHSVCEQTSSPGVAGIENRNVSRNLVMRSLQKEGEGEQEEREREREKTSHLQMKSATNSGLIAELVPKFLSQGHDDNQQIIIIVKI